MRKCTAVILVAVTAACGKSTKPASTPAPTAVAVTTTSTTTLTATAYARALLDIRSRYLFHPGENYGKAAEALNLLVPSPGFALRHRQLVAEMLALTNPSGGPAQQGAAQGTAEAHLLNLAREADPNVS